ncbi:MAG: EamA family transporter RarD [Clostridiales bacterium]|nr:EamA family transporter RarD [Clostridiales bacterium]
MQKMSSYKKGLIYALSCSILWGVLPIYWQALRPIESSVIIFYRIFLVGVVCFIASIKLYGMKEMKKHLRPKGAKLKFFLAGLLITTNWSIYIWAVNADFVIQTCVGYYIEPLMVCVFGIIFFKEKLTGYKLTALIFAMMGVVVMLVHFMQVPLIALSLGLTFATYAALKKSYQLPSVLSLFYETMFLALPALGVVIYLEVNGQGALALGDPVKYILLMFCGPLTAIALAFFAEAANNVPLVTLGLIEYLSPSISLIIGIFMFKEPFDMIQFIAFVIVWIGLVFFTIGEKKETSQEVPIDGEEIFDIFGNNFDRFAFPATIKRVTAGHGGEALIIFGSEKTALLDCGMAYCGDLTIENIRKTLKREKRSILDYVILSHSHYDHIGALPYIREAFPNVVVCGSYHCSEILKKDSARQLMKELGTAAKILYRPAYKKDIPMEGLGVDRVLKDGDVLELGEEKVTAYETRGHTNCSMSYYLEPQNILFTSESTGILEADFVHTPILKSFDDAFESVEKCRNIDADHICLPHFGLLPESYNESYWDMFKDSCQEKMDFVRGMSRKGLTEEEMLEKYVDKYWVAGQEKEQPREAFVLNSGFILKALLRAI